MICCTSLELLVRVSKNVSIKGNLGCVFKFSIEDELAFLLKSFIKLQNHKKKNQFKIAKCKLDKVEPKTKFGDRWSLSLAGVKL